MAPAKNLTFCQHKRRHRKQTFFTRQTRSKHKAQTRDESHVVSLTKQAEREGSLFGTGHPPVTETKTKHRLSRLNALQNACHASV